MIDPLSHTLLTAARELRAELSARAAAVENARRADPETIGKLAQAGMFRMLVPKQHGGLEVHPLSFVAVLHELARADAATAWCVMTGSTAGILAAYMSKEGADQLWGQNPNVVMASIFAPMGRAVREGDGYRVSGRWPFASGCQGASWHAGGAFIMDDGKPELDADGRPINLQVFFPASHSTVHDTWKVSGLRGTGSHDIEINDVLVPAAHTALIVGQPPRARCPLTAFPPFGLLACGVAAVGTGIARAALDEIRALVQSKKSAGSRKPLASRELVQVEIARAEAELEAARALMAARLEEGWQRAQTGNQIDLETRAAIRMAASHAVKAATRAVDTAYTMGGGTSIYAERSNLQRHLRDVHTVTQHIMVAPTVDQMVGRVLLDQGGDFAML
jgi:alkylation response protein AidB-like acyl-CoA dehydrogenase